MKFKNWTLTALVVAAMSGMTFGQLPGMPSDDESMRPSDGPPPTVSVAPQGPLRGSLFQQGAMAPVPVGVDGQPMGPAPVSFTAVSEPAPHKFKKNDLVTVIVQEDSTYQSTADGKSQKQQDYDLAIQQFLQLATSASGLPTVGVVGQPSKLPEIKFKYDNNRQNQASQDRTDTFTVRIAATIVDVKPNGTCVIEASKTIKMDREVQIFRLSGVCRTADVTPDNTILSTQLANLEVSKSTTGEVRDGVKSGWLNKLIDRINPL